MSSHIYVLHQHVADDAPNEEQDVLKEVSYVKESLIALGFDAHTLEFGSDPLPCMEQLRQTRPAFVFNKVDTYRGSARLMHLAPAMLEALEIPYVGCSSETMAVANNKLLSKRIFLHAGLPAAPLLGEPGSEAFSHFIIKSVWEHGSYGLTQENVVTAARAPALLKKRQQQFGGQWIAEGFIAGRDISVVVLQHGDTLETTPFEVVTQNDDNQWAIQDYAMKYDYSVPEEYAGHVVREFSAGFLPVVEKARSIALSCWELFHLRHFARIDLRVDERGNPHILEINATPCLLPETGMMRFCGKSYTDVIEKIVGNVVKLRSHDEKAA